MSTLMIVHLHPILNPTFRTAALAVEALLFLYFIVSNAVYLWTAILALKDLPRFIKRHAATPLRTFGSRFEKPVTVLIPAFNESSNVVATVRSALRFDYPEFEIIVINDGSTDDTLPLLISAFKLERSTDSCQVMVFPTRVVRGVYRSHIYPNLCVIDKINGGKSDALNVGINYASCPLLLCLDGDSYYVPETLTALTEPFLQDPRTVVSTGSICVSNGSEFRNGSLSHVRLSRNPIVIFQALEYLRAFLHCRVAWARLNSITTVSGALGMYRKDIVAQVGGFRTDIIWEDTELTIRIHHYMRAQKRPYRVAFTPYPVCWTMVPDTLSALWNQRVGWHRHVSEVVTIHRRLLFRPGSGAIGWFGFPALALFEWAAPFAVLFGLGFAADAWYYGILSTWSQIVLLVLVFSLALLLSVTAILLDELSFGTYGVGGMFKLLFFSLVENFGYRQFNTLANLAGIIRWVFYRRVQGKRRVEGVFIRGYEPAKSPNWRS